MQSQLIHARLHAGRHVAGAGGVRRHRQAPHRRLDHMPFAGCALGSGLGDGFGRRRGLRRRGGVQAEPSRNFLADFQITQHRADRVTFIPFDEPLLDVAGARRSHVHGRL